MKLEKQIERVKLLDNMMNEKLNEYIEGQKKYEEWKENTPRDWGGYPKMIPKSEVKDRMKLLRQEMIKLDKML